MRDAGLALIGPPGNMGAAHKGGSVFFNPRSFHSEPLRPPVQSISPSLQMRRLLVRSLHLAESTADIAASFALLAVLLNTLWPLGHPENSEKFTTPSRPDHRLPEDAEAAKTEKAAEGRIDNVTMDNLRRMPRRDAGGPERTAYTDRAMMELLSKMPGRQSAHLSLA